MRDQYDRAPISNLRVRHMSSLVSIGSCVSFDLVGEHGPCCHLHVFGLGASLTLGPHAGGMARSFGIALDLCWNEVGAWEGEKR